MAHSHPITALPFELVQDISSYLEKSELRSFRLAVPNAIVSAATAPILFHTITLRLGNRVNSHEKLISQSKYVSNLSILASQTADEFPWDNTSDGIFRYTRKLVVDTRYPFVVNDDTLQKLRKMGKEYKFRPSGDPKEHEETVKQIEAELFLDTLEDMLQIIRWRLQDINVAYTFRSLRMVGTFLHPVSGCDNLDLRFDGWQSCRLTEFEMEPVVEAVGRCPGLRGFGINTRSHPVTDSGSEKIRDAISKVEDLERLDLRSSKIKLPDPLPSFKAGKLKTLRLIQRDYCYGLGPTTERILTEVTTARNRLETLTLTGYTWSVEPILKQQMAITDLEIWAKSGSGMAYKSQGFWEEVIPVLADKLRRLRVYYLSEGGWSWYDYEDNMAKVALRKCGNLEEVMVSCGQDKASKNCILEMMEDLMVHCPKLGKMNVKFCVIDQVLNMQEKLDSTEKLLDGWSSTGDLSRVLFGRDFEVVYNNKPHMGETFGLKNADGLTQPLAWDRYIQRWKLARVMRDGQSLYRLQRMADEYCFEE
ncbi:hypothetical protein TWF281_002955 [Arthrobotrys megalospora]